MTGGSATLDGDGRSWAQVASERLTDALGDTGARETGREQMEVTHVAA